jgi:stage II sporulation protein D
MKKKILILPLSVFAMYIFLIIVMTGFGFFGKNYLKKPSQPNPTTTKQDLKISVLMGDKVEVLDLEKYIRGVVSAEMPGSFETEALKAQAVAARTYTYAKTKSKNKDHPNATVCTNPAHCKAYISLEDANKKFGADWEKNFYTKISSACNETRAKIVVYNNEPISAVFHSTSSGMTENSKDVWGGDLPYLVSVKSEGEDASPRYLDEVTLSFDSFKEKINSGTTKVKFTKTPKKWITDIKRNQSGSVATLNICGTPFKGTEIRTLLAIRSTNFEITLDKNVDIKTKGNGHGVGMSQYGANYMAKKGYSYTDILKKYYTGVELSEIKQ